MDITKDYVVLVDLVIRLVESQAGKGIDSGNVWINDAQALSKKLFHHLTSMQSISAGTTVSVHGRDQFSFIDHSSVVVMARAALETLLIFCHVYGDDDHELSKFRHSLWRLSGLLSRQPYPALREENREKLHSEAKEIESLKAEIQSNSFFAGYSEKQQRQILKGNWDFNTSWQDIAVKAGFHPVYFRMIYSFLCGYSHACYISAMQIGQATTIEEQRDLALPMLQIGGIIMSFFALTYVRLFPSAKDILSTDKNAEKTAECWHLTKDKLSGIYGH